MTTIRTHVLLPESLLKAIDGLVGQRKRSRFISEAVAEKIERIRLAQALEDAAGSLSHVEVDGWASSQEAREWVEELRSFDKLRGLEEAPS